MFFYKFFFALGMIARVLMDIFYQQEEAFLQGYSMEFDFGDESERQDQGEG